MSGFVTVSELAERSNLSVAYVRRLVVTGRIPGKKAGYTWVVSEADAARWLESRRASALGFKQSTLAEAEAKRGIDISSAELGELGRFIASRTANTSAARIARSSAPQLRYDGVAFNLVHDPQVKGLFTLDELLQLARRISDEPRRLAALRFLDDNKRLFE